jgi:hypothetical protein
MLKKIYTIDFSDKLEDLFDLNVPSRVFKVPQKLNSLKGEILLLTLQFFSNRMIAGKII